MRLLLYFNNALVQNLGYKRINATFGTIVIEKIWAPAG